MPHTRRRPSNSSAPPHLDGIFETSGPPEVERFTVSWADMGLVADRSNTNSEGPTLIRDPSDAIEEEFRELAERWKAETAFLSSAISRASHEAYQSIIGLGYAVVPILIKELAARTGDWYWALKAITRQDPVPREDRGDVEAMREAWLTWADERGYDTGTS